MKPVLHSFAYSLDFLRELVADVPAEKMMAQPAGVKNHAAWTIGHLTFVLQMLGGVAGVGGWLAEDWARRYGPGSSPRVEASENFSKRFCLGRLAMRRSASVLPWRG